MTPGPSSIPEELRSVFDRLQIQVKTSDHEPIFTVEEGRHLEELIPGAHTKNLFLEDKKNRVFYLVVLLGRDRLDIKAFAKQMGLPSFSFGSAENMRAMLCLEPGSVTPFALLHESARAIRVILDAAMMQHELLNYHPLRNDQTTTIQREDFLRFLRGCGHEPQIIELPKKLEVF